MENPEQVLMELNTFEKEPLDNLPKVGLRKVIWLHDSVCGSTFKSLNYKISDEISCCVFRCWRSIWYLWQRQATRQASIFPISINNVFVFGNPSIGFLSNTHVQVFPWPKIKPAVRVKLESVIADFSLAMPEEQVGSFSLC